MGFGTVSMLTGKKETAVSAGTEVLSTFVTAERATNHFTADRRTTIPAHDP
jgi:hypothetical protein